MELGQYTQTQTYTHIDVCDVCSWSNVLCLCLLSFRTHIPLGQAQQVLQFTVVFCPFKDLHQWNDFLNLIIILHIKTKISHIVITDSFWFHSSIHQWQTPKSSDRCLILTTWGGGACCSRNATNDSDATSCSSSFFFLGIPVWFKHVYLNDSTVQHTVD